LTSKRAFLAQRSVTTRRVGCRTYAAPHAPGAVAGMPPTQKKYRSLFDPLVTRSLSGYINSVALGGSEKEILGKGKIISRANQVIPETNY
jgi:hypothetical protein